MRSCGTLDGILLLDAVDALLLVIDLLLDLRLVHPVDNDVFPLRDVYCQRCQTAEKIRRFWYALRFTCVQRMLAVEDITMQEAYPLVIVKRDLSYRHVPGFLWQSMGESIRK